MANGAVIYSIARGKGLDSLAVKRLGSIAAVKSNYTALVPLVAHGKTYCVGYDAASGDADVFQFSAKAPWLKRVAAKPHLGPGHDLVDPLTIGNDPYLLAYSKKKGIFAFFAVAADLSVSKPYTHYDNHGPPVSLGFTTVKPFDYFGQVGLLAYNGSDGAVATYNVSVTATSDQKIPPLQQHALWSHSWAKGWTRFALFQFGGENFFLKTNTDKPNVNIDHIMDSPQNGTVEVATKLHLANAQKLDLVEPFVLSRGEPYFVTYMKKGGKLTCNRFHHDSKGWTQVASLASKSNAGQIAAFTAAGKTYLVVA